MDTKTINILTCIGITVLLGFMFIMMFITSKEARIRNQQDWQEYKTRCEELGGIASQRFIGYQCDK